MIQHNDEITFAPIKDAYTDASAIGVSGVYAGRRLKLGARVVTGARRHEDDTVSYKYSRWVEYEREWSFTYKLSGVEREYKQLVNGRALIPDGDYMVIALTVRKEAAA